MRALYTLAAVAVTFVLALLLFSCSGGQSERETGEEGAVQEGTGEDQASDAASTQAPSTDDSSNLRAALVPVAHLTSAREDLSIDELSEALELAVPRELHESAERSLGRSDFEDFGSTDEVLDRVSRDSEAIGVVPWDEVDPRVKALAVDGTSLLDPDAASCPTPTPSPSSSTSSTPSAWARAAR